MFNVEFTFEKDLKEFIKKRLPLNSEIKLPISGDNLTVEDAIRNADSKNKISHLFSLYIKHQNRILKGNKVEVSQELKKKMSEDILIYNNVKNIIKLINYFGYVPVEFYSKKIVKIYEDQKYNYKGFYHLHLRTNSIIDSEEDYRNFISDNHHNELLFAYENKGVVYLLDIGNHEYFPSRNKIKDIHTDKELIEILDKNWDRKSTNVYTLNRIQFEDISDDILANLKEYNCIAPLKNDLLNKDMLNIRDSHFLLDRYYSLANWSVNNLSALKKDIEIKIGEPLKEIGMAFDNELTFNYVLVANKNTAIRYLGFDEFIVKNMDNRSFVKNV